MKAAQRLLDDPRLATLFAALAKTGAETRVVGGAVRDALLGLPPHEIDLATTALPDAVLAAARERRTERRADRHRARHGDDRRRGNAL